MWESVRKGCSVCLSIYYKNLEKKNYFDNWKTRENRNDTLWFVLIAWVVVFYWKGWRIIDDFVRPVTVNFVLVCCHVPSMNKNEYIGWMVGPWYNSRYVYIQQIGQDSFTYHMTSPVEDKFSDQKYKFHWWNNLEILYPHK